MENNRSIHLNENKEPFSNKKDVQVVSVGVERTHKLLVYLKYSESAVRA